MFWIVVKLQIVFKSQNKLASVFWFYHLTQCLEWYVNVCVEDYDYGETNMHSKVSSGEHVGIPSLTFGKVKSSKETAIHCHLLICNNASSFDEFTFLVNGHHKYVLEIKESLLSMIDLFWIRILVLSNFLFDINQNFECFYYNTENWMKFYGIFNYF